ncbi:MAG: hypothetical protein WC527_00005 [Candidatus Margulisiibacteriota bacterium]
MAIVKVNLNYGNRTISRLGLSYNRIFHPIAPRNLAREVASASTSGNTKLFIRNSQVVLDTNGSEQCLGSTSAARTLQKAGISSITIPANTKQKEISTVLRAVLSRWPSATSRILGTKEGESGTSFLHEAMRQGYLIEEAKEKSPNAIFSLYKLIKTGCSPDKLAGLPIKKVPGYRPFFLARLFGRTENAPFNWIAGHKNTPDSILFKLACEGEGYALVAFKALHKRGMLSRKKETKIKVSFSGDLVLFCQANKTKYNYNASSGMLIVKGEMSEEEKYLLSKIYDGREQDQVAIERLYQGSQTLNMLANSANRSVKDAVIDHPVTSTDTLVKLAMLPERCAIKALERLDPRTLTPLQITMLACSKNDVVLRTLAQYFVSTGILDSDVTQSQLGARIFDHFNAHTPFEAKDIDVLFSRELLSEELAAHPNTEKKTLMAFVRKGGRQPKEVFITPDPRLSRNNIEILAQSAFDNLGNKLSADDLEELANSPSPEIKLRIINHPNVSIAGLLLVAYSSDRSAIVALKKLKMNELSSDMLLFLLCSRNKDVQQSVATHVKAKMRSNADNVDEIAARLFSSKPFGAAQARKFLTLVSKMPELQSTIRTHLRNLAIRYAAGKVGIGNLLDKAFKGGTAVLAYGQLNNKKLLGPEILLYLSLSPVPYVSTKAKALLSKAAEASLNHENKEIEKDAKEKLKTASDPKSSKSEHAIKWLKERDLLSDEVLAYLSLSNLPYFALYYMQP